MNYNNSLNNRDRLISISKLFTSFDNNIIHSDLCLNISSGSILALVGGSGSGKTTLLRVIIMLTKPISGSIKIFGQEVIGISEEHAFLIRKRIGVLFQRGALFSNLTVSDNISFPLEENTKLSKKQIKEIVNLKIAMSGLPINTGNKLPRELSGGMVKRAALARALALDPEILFLDEPTAGLDPVSAGKFDDLILILKESLGLTVVMITHDLDTMWYVTDQVAFIAEKRIIGCAPIRDLVNINHPQIYDYFHGIRGLAAENRCAE